MMVYVCTLRMLHRWVPRLHATDVLRSLFLPPSPCMGLSREFGTLECCWFHAPIGKNLLEMQLGCSHVAWTQKCICRDIDHRRGPETDTFSNQSYTTAEPGGRAFCARKSRSSAHTDASHLHTQILVICADKITVIVAHTHTYTHTHTTVTCAKDFHMG